MGVAKIFCSRITLFKYASRDKRCHVYACLVSLEKNLTEKVLKKGGGYKQQNALILTFLLFPQWMGFPGRLGVQFKKRLDKGKSTLQRREGGLSPFATP